MALGKVVLASNLAGIPEQIKDRETGFLFSPGDCNKLSLLMIDLINNDNKREMELSAKKRFDDNFTEKIAVKKYIDLYER